MAHNWRHLWTKSRGEVGQLAAVDKQKSGKMEGKKGDGEGYWASWDDGEEEEGKQTERQGRNEKGVAVLSGRFPSKSEVISEVYCLMIQKRRRFALLRRGL